MPVYQTGPGNVSTTVMPGATPKNSSVSFGWRKAYRDLASSGWAASTASSLAEASGDVAAAADCAVSAGGVAC